jgi:hypothetical protein
VENTDKERISQYGQGKMPAASITALREDPFKGWFDVTVQVFDSKKQRFIGVEDVVKGEWLQPRRPEKDDRGRKYIEECSSMRTVLDDDKIDLGRLDAFVPPGLGAAESRQLKKMLAMKTCRDDGYDCTYKI